MLFFVMSPRSFFLASALHVRRADPSVIASGAEMSDSTLGHYLSFASALRGVRRAISASAPDNPNALAVRYEISEICFGAPSASSQDWTLDERGALLGHRQSRTGGQFLRGREPSDYRFALHELVVVSSFPDGSAKIGVVGSRPPTAAEVAKHPRFYRKADDLYIVDYPPPPGTTRPRVGDHTHVLEEAMIPVTWPIADELRERLLREAALGAASDAAAGPQDAG